MTIIVSRQVRYRLLGDEDNDWVTEVFPADTVLSIGNLLRDGEYEVEVRNVGANGRLSDPVTFTHTVADTKRMGALALPVNAIGNIASTWDYDTEVEYNSTDSTATIDFLGGTLVSGGTTIVYGASSTTISVEPEEEFELFLWLDDPFLLGGTVQLECSRNYLDSVAGPGYIALAPLTITAPPVGGSSSGGGNIGGGGGGGGGGKIPQAEP